MSDIDDDSSVGSAPPYVPPHVGQPPQYPQLVVEEYHVAESAHPQPSEEDQQTKPQYVPEAGTVNDQAQPPQTGLQVPLTGQQVPSVHGSQVIVVEQPLDNTRWCYCCCWRFRCGLPKGIHANVDTFATADDADPYRRYCCCCRCCHVRTLCTIILIYQLVSCIWYIVNATNPTVKGTDAVFKAIQGVNIGCAVITVVGCIVGFIAIFKVKPKLVTVYIGSIILTIVVGAITGVVVISILATNPESAEGALLFGMIFLIGQVISISLSCWFIHEFRKLRLFLEDVLRSAHGDAPPQYKA